MFVLSLFLLNNFRQSQLGCSYKVCSYKKKSDSVIHNLSVPVMAMRYIHFVSIGLAVMRSYGDILYLPVYNAHPCIMHTCTPILKPVFRKKEKTVSMSFLTKNK